MIARNERKLAAWREHYDERRNAPPGGWHDYLRAAWIDGAWDEAYRLYLRSWAWDQRRKGAIRRVEGKCQLCGSGHRLNVHHVSYHNVGKEPCEDVRVLCKSCHGVRHTQVKGAQPLPLDARTLHRKRQRLSA